MDERCYICDSRYCGPGCDGREGYVYAPGYGWVAPAEAKALEAKGRTIYWDDVFTGERFGVAPIPA